MSRSASMFLEAMAKAHHDDIRRKSAEAIAAWCFAQFFAWVLGAARGKGER